MIETKVILVDESDNPVGVMEKMEAHRKGLLHRAISVFIINARGEWLLQKRAMDKYHSMGLWTNACCTHPMPGEPEEESALRRLDEEMGMTCNLRKLFDFVYREKMDNDLTEYEFDHVFIGVTDEDPLINRSEVDDWKRLSFSEIQREIEINPEDYTFWFKEIYREVNEHIINLKNNEL